MVVGESPAASPEGLRTACTAVTKAEGLPLPGAASMLLLLLGRKGQDGDLGAATALVLSTLWQRRGTAGARGLLQAVGALLLPSPWFPSTWSPCKLVWKPAPNDQPGFYWTC